jgi:hypothetical protein
VQKRRFLSDFGLPNRRVHEALPQSRWRQFSRRHGGQMNVTADPGHLPGVKHVFSWAKKNR